MKQHYYLTALGLCSPVGDKHKAVLDNLLQGNRGLSLSEEFTPDKPLMTGTIFDDLPSVPQKLSSYDCRNNRLALKALEALQPGLDAAIAQYGDKRIAVVVGTSTSGVLSGENALQHKMQTGSFPESFDYRQQEVGTVAEFLASYLQLGNLALTISTACSSSARALGVARNLLEADICDAVLVGGVDTLCRLTLYGFGALQAISAEPCLPFSRNRSGINIGEAAALFLMEKTSRGTNNITLCGFGQSSDAYHVSAPDPEGGGAKRSMIMALSDAGLDPEDIDYINLHGTATPLNDAMESQAVFEVFSDKVACSSTKALTGHTLGAAGALEAAFCWLLLSLENERKLLPPQVFDNQRDESLPAIALVEAHQKSETLRYCLSNSFAFGGNNATVILGRLS